MNNREREKRNEVDWWTKELNIERKISNKRPTQDQNNKGSISRVGVDQVKVMIYEWKSCKLKTWLMSEQNNEQNI